MSNSIVAADLETIRTGARILFKQKQLVEVRVLEFSGYWRGFYFDDHDRMAEVVQKLDGDKRIQSIYYVFNEIDPEFVEKRKGCQCDRCIRGGLIVKNPTDAQVEQIIEGPTQHLTSNEDVRTLNWMFIDVDTIRAEGHEHESSTKEEKAAARDVAKKVLAYLEEKGWPQPLLADSGNGFHILPRINLPNTPENIGHLVDCLKALALKFNTEAGEIDDSVFNAARLTRAYGTHTRKGEESADRKWRQNRIVSDPQTYIGAVNFDLITALSGEGPKTKIRGDMPLLHESFDPDDFFAWYEDQGAFTVSSTKPWGDNTIAVTDMCIISQTKHTGSKLTGFIIGDTFGYHCWSPECNAPQIGDVLRKLSELGFKRYPKKIWVEEPLLLNFEEKQGEFDRMLEEEGEQYHAPHKEPLPVPAAPVATKPPEPKITDFEAEEVTEEDEPEVEQTQEDTEPEPEPSPMMEAIAKSIAQEAAEEGKAVPPPVKTKTIQIGDIEPNRYAEWLMGIITNDPKKIGLDYGFYKKRLEKLARHLTDTVREAFGAMIMYEREFRKLPSKVDLLDYITNSETCREHKMRDEMIAFVKAVKHDESRTFDVIAQRLIWEMDWRLESEIVRDAFKKELREKKDIQGFRTALRKHWATGIGIDSDFKPGTWQENADLIYEAFRRDFSGEGDERKFKLGFNTIDESGMNIGLDGNHAIVLYGPAANRKTNAAMTIALNFAMQGKRGLFLAGEHHKLKIEKRLTLMLSYYLRQTDDNPNGIVPVIPGLPKWEGLTKDVNEDDLANIGIVLAELKQMRIVPGFIEVQNIDSLIRGEEDALGAIMAYIDATDKKYQWDFVIIDPLDSVLPNDAGDKNQFQASAAVVDRLFQYSRNFRGDNGLMIVVTAQFKAETRREIEKIQQKNTGIDDYDDEIMAVLRKDSNIQYIGNKLTQRFDLAMGVALRTQNGDEGMLVQGRSREGGNWDVMYFSIDEDANLMLEKTGNVKHKAAGEVAGEHAAPMREQTMAAYDQL